MDIAVFWFRRDLRIVDNTAFLHALQSGLPVLPLFIFDTNITDQLPADDARLNFIYNSLHKLNQEITNTGSSLQVFKGNPLEIWKIIFGQWNVKQVFVNEDYEPYAIKRDQQIKILTQQNGAGFHSFKDQVIFNGTEVLKKDGKPYTVFTPYKKQWLDKWQETESPKELIPQLQNLLPVKTSFPEKAELEISGSNIVVKDYHFDLLDNYAEKRDFPAADSGSYLGPHLRFGTVSIRNIIRQLKPKHEIFLSELIWREFFMQILFHFPEVVKHSFKPAYDEIKWRNNEDEFALWCVGKTGYPMVDAGMRELNKTGYMHNRVRMVVASFLCKHLLIDWRWGETYFAQKLLDYELSSNNGNWQWAAGTGCDAAPYFRVFNPTTQLEKFDKKLQYVKKWVPEYETPNYPVPMVEHSFARQRAIGTYKRALTNIK